MSKGKAKEPLSISDIGSIPVTASIHRASQLTGLSWETIKGLVDSKTIVGVKTSKDSSKVMVSMFSLLVHLGFPVEVLERIWSKKTA